jgi:type IV pilus assembly protein PilO
MALDFKDLAKLKWYYQVLIVATVCGGLLGGVWYQFLSPKQDDIATKTKQVDELQKTIANAQQQQKRLAQIKKDAIELQAKLEMLKTVLPQEKEIPQVLGKMQELATMSGVQLKSLTSRPTSDRDVYLEWPIEVDVVGTYHSVTEFLDRIRQLPRIMNISAVRFQSASSAGDAASTSSISAHYTATTFVYKDEPIASTAPAAKPVK